MALRATADRSSAAFSRLQVGFTGIFPVVGVGARNIRDDRYVGPLAEGAGKVNVGRAVEALRDGAVIYSAANEGGVGHHDLQGT